MNNVAFLVIAIITLSGAFAAATSAEGSLFMQLFVW